MAPVIDTQPLKNMIRDTEEELKNPKPTPPVSTPVVWYDRAQVSPEAQINASVTKIEGPGKVTLSIVRPHHFPEHKRAVLHVSDPIHEKVSNPTSIQNGAWDYPDHTRIPKAHYDLHVAALEKKLNSVRQQLKEAEEIKAKQEGAAA